jgi:hypothetical protein
MADAARSQITRGALKYISTIPKKAILLIPSSAIFNDPDRLQRDFPVPICQCVQIKSLTTTTEGQPERYRLVLSDIDHYVQSMLATRKFPRRILGYRVKQSTQRQITSCMRESSRRVALFGSSHTRQILSKARSRWDSGSVDEYLLTNPES